MRAWWLSGIAFGLGALARGTFRYALATLGPVVLFAWFVGSKELRARGGQLAAWWAAAIGIVVALLASALLVYELIPRAATLTLITLGIPVLQGLGAWLGEPGSTGKSLVLAVCGAYIGQAVYWRLLLLGAGVSMEEAVSGSFRAVVAVWLFALVPMVVAGAFGAGVASRRAA